MQALLEVQLWLLRKSLSGWRYSYIDSEGEDLKKKCDLWKEGGLFNPCFFYLHASFSSHCCSHSYFSCLAGVKFGWSNGRRVAAFSYQVFENTGLGSYTLCKVCACSYSVGVNAIYLGKHFNLFHLHRHRTISHQLRFLVDASPPS